MWIQPNPFKYEGVFKKSIIKIINFRIMKIGIEKALLVIHNNTFKKKYFFSKHCC